MLLIWLVKYKFMNKEQMLICCKKPLLLLIFFEFLLKVFQKFQNLKKLLNIYSILFFLKKENKDLHIEWVKHILCLKIYLKKMKIKQKMILFKMI